MEKMQIEITIIQDGNFDERDKNKKKLYRFLF